MAITSNKDLNDNEVERLSQTMEGIVKETLRIIDFDKHLKFKYESDEKMEGRLLQENGSRKAFEYRTSYGMYQDKESAKLIYHVILPDFCFSDRDLIFCSTEGQTMIVTRERRQSITFLLNHTPDPIELVVIFFCDNESTNRFNMIRNTARRQQKRHKAENITQEQIDFEISSGGEYAITKKVKENLGC